MDPIGFRREPEVVLGSLQHDPNEALVVTWNEKQALDWIRLCLSSLSMSMVPTLFVVYRGIEECKEAKRVLEQMTQSENI